MNKPIDQCLLGERMRSIRSFGRVIVAVVVYVCEQEGRVCPVALTRPHTELLLTMDGWLGSSLVVFHISSVKLLFWQIALMFLQVFVFLVLDAGF